MTSLPDRHRGATTWIVICVVAALAIVVAVLTVSLLSKLRTETGPTGTSSDEAATSESATPHTSSSASSTPDQTSPPATTRPLTSSPPVVNPTNIAVAAGGSRTCALTSSGGVKCWGDNSFGQLGDGTTTNSSVPVDVSSLGSGVIAIAVGSGLETCALTSGGGVKCWGAIITDASTPIRSVPVDVPGLTSGVTAIAAGTYFTCALTSDGGVKCWGFNDSGQLGDGTMTNSSVPVDVSGLTSGVSAVFAGYAHVCALTSDGSVLCWGSNASGQLGDGTTTNSSVPVNVSGPGSGVSLIAAGISHTCALTSGGAVKCWGENSFGQLGDGSTLSRTRPVDIWGLASGVSAIAAGGTHTCALTKGGRVKCWGWNGLGQLGDGTTLTQTPPVDVLGLGSGSITIAAGTWHTCALTSSGGVRCWGDNRSGQLGDDTTISAAFPVDVHFAIP